MIDTQKLTTICDLILIDEGKVTDDKTAIDFAARLRLHIAELGKVERELTKSLTGDVTLDHDTPQGNSATLPGLHFYASITETVRWSLDTKAVRAEMGDDWFNERCKQSVVRGVKYFDNE